MSPFTFSLQLRARILGQEMDKQKFLCCPVPCKEFAAWHYWTLYHLNWKQDWELYLDNKTTTLREERKEINGG